MRARGTTALVCAAIGVIAGCGEETVALPRSGAAYRSLGPKERLAAAEGCRDQAAASAEGVAAEQIGKVDPRVLRAQLDLALRSRPHRRFAFRRLCSDTLPYVTPGVEVTFAGATDSGDAYTLQTRSDKPLTMRGAVSPAGRGGYVVARREFGAPTPFRAAIRPDGRFVMPTVRLRKQANNSFIVAIHAPPNAPRKVHFSAICVDCLASG